MQGIQKNLRIRTLALQGNPDQFFPRIIPNFRSQEISKFKSKSPPAKLVNEDCKWGICGGFGTIQCYSSSDRIHHAMINQAR